LETERKSDSREIRRVARRKRQPPLGQDFLSSKPVVRGGDICATGTRIPVTVILDNLAEGAVSEEIVASYPSLRPKHIQAALAYAAELAHEDAHGSVRVWAVNDRYKAGDDQDR
jgi:uncharacterized protein (DUF433 family)